MGIVLLPLVLLPAFYLLWRNGLLILNCKRALLYLDTRIPNGRKVTFGSCSGYTKRALRPSSRCRYRFILSGETTRGKARAEIRGRGREVLLSLDCENPSQTLDTGGGGRYYLVFCFEKADGTLSLSWMQEENLIQ